VLAGCHLAALHMALAATIRMKLVELTLVERILRKIAPIKPHAQLCHEFAFVVHRPRREALAAETGRKCLDVDCQRAYAGRLDPRRRAIIEIGHHSSPLSRGKSLGQRRRLNNAESPTINADPNH
jgi:hypothetical protein